MARGHGVAILLLVATLLSCTAAGAVFAYGYFETARAGSLAAAMTPHYLGLGFLLYAVPLLAILGVHELAHYAVMRRRGLAASLPWFIPFPPPIGFSGTFGAVINLRDQMPDRRTLVRVAAAGPLAGLVVAIAVLLIGFSLSQAPGEGQGGDGITIQTPLLYDGLARIMGVPESASVHPLAIAGWLGLFLTSLQLIPVGQLDGGHLLRAYAGRAARPIGWAVVLGLVVLAFVSGFYAWILFAFVAVVTGLLQPTTSVEGALTWKESALTAGCAVAFLLTFVAAPLSL